LVRGIAWSKLGSVASISQSGAGLEFRTIRCHPVDGSWDLSEPTLVPQVNPVQDGISLQHLCWSLNGSDLAAIDAVGRVFILTISTFMNKPSLVRSGHTDSTEDLHAVVGAYWLNLLPAQNRPVGHMIHKKKIHALILIRMFSLQ
jgi:mediator of RNA polymerase II transcription subunit 16, fungi type